MISRLFVPVCALACAVLTASGVEPSILRLLEDETGSVRLQVPVKVFESPGGDRVTLVGVAHVGEAAYYAELQEILDGYDLVLYEGIAAPWRDLPEGASTSTRARFTESRLDDASAMLVDDARTHGAPADESEWLERTPSFRRRHLQEALIDGWGREVAVEIDHRADGSDFFTLTSLGADGQPGGERFGADIIRSGTLPVATGEASNAIQLRLAQAAGLRFQLDTIDYSSPSWVNSDATVDDLGWGEPEEGGGAAQGDAMIGLLSGDSGLAKFMGGVLGMIGRSERASFMFRLMLIETLAMTDEFIEAGAMGEGMHDTLVVKRNAVVMRDLERELDQRADGADIAVFYGSAHLPDFEQRLGALGFEAGEVEWITAIEADPQDVGMDPAQATRLRAMLRGMLEKQLDQLDRMTP